MIVLILAAGYATRLYPLTLNRPKPLLEVGGKPIIEHIFAKIGALDGVSGCFIVTNHKFYGGFKKWAAFFPFKTPIRVVDDETTTNENRLGAVRDIAFVIGKVGINEDLLVIGGDNLFEFDLGRFADFAKRHSPNASIAVFDIKEKEKAKIYGVVKIDSAEMITGFDEKPPRPESALISTCVYYFPRETLGFIQEFLSSGNKADAPGNYIRWLSMEKKAYAFAFSEAWYDIGDIASYEEADRKYKTK